ncbi:MAG: hypothetical protein Q9220_001838 [cf. Caloplaca sp. 1 TL-2023]
MSRANVPKDFKPKQTKIPGKGKKKVTDEDPQEESLKGEIGMGIEEKNKKLEQYHETVVEAAQAAQAEVLKYATSFSFKGTEWTAIKNTAENNRDERSEMYKTKLNCSEFAIINGQTSSIQALLQAVHKPQEYLTTWQKPKLPDGLKMGDLWQATKYSLKSHRACHVAKCVLTDVKDPFKQEQKEEANEYEKSRRCDLYKGNPKMAHEKILELLKDVSL